MTADFCDDFEGAVSFLDVKTKWGPDNASDTAWGFTAGRNSRQAVRAQGAQVSPESFEARLRHTLGSVSKGELELRFDVRVTSCDECELARVAVLNGSGGNVDSLSLRLRSSGLELSHGADRLGESWPVLPVGLWATVRLTSSSAGITLSVDQGQAFNHPATALSSGVRAQLSVGPYRTQQGPTIDVAYDNVAVRSR